MGLTEAGTLFFCLLALLFGCGSAATAEPDIDPIYQTYYEHFLEDAAKEHTDVNPSGLTIITVPSIANDKKGIVTRGDCLMSAKRVRISKKYWDLSTEGQREHLIYHELGHCLLYRHHTDKKMIVNDKIVWGSIMSPSGLPADSDNAEKHITVGLRKHYVHELFTERK